MNSVQWQNKKVSVFTGRRDTQYNDTRHSNIQHNDTQHRGIFSTLSITALCHYADYHILFIVILNVTMPIAVMLPKCQYAECRGAKRIAQFKNTTQEGLRGKWCETESLRDR